LCRWHATYHWKTLDKGYNFVLNLISIRGLHVKLWGPEVARILILAISGLPLGMWVSWKGTKYSIRGEGGGFPQI